MGRNIGIRKLLLAGTLGAIALLAGSGIAVAETGHPAWVITPGHEAAVTSLMAPYWQADKPPSLAKAMIRQTVIEVEADSGAGIGTFTLRHGSDTSAAAGELVKGGDAQLDIDIQCAACTDAGKATLRTMAAAVIAHQKASGAQVWSFNPDKVKKPAGEGGKSWHAKTRILLAMAGLGVALVAGILIARSRRRKATAPAATSAPQSTDSPEV